MGIKVLTLQEAAWAENERCANLYASPISNMHDVKRDGNFWYEKINF